MIDISPVKVEKVPVLGRPAPMRTYSTSTESFVMARFELQSRDEAEFTNRNHKHWMDWRMYRMYSTTQLK